MKCQERCSTFCLNGALTKKVCAATGAGTVGPDRRTKLIEGDGEGEREREAEAEGDTA